MNKIELCVEILCVQGCGSVRTTISRLESGEVLPETEDLTNDELSKVIKELKSIMAVYGDSCPISL